MTANLDAYAVLQVDPRAEDFVISAAFRALARRFHPDGATPDAERMAQVNGAYDQVKTPEARRRYDAGRSRPVAVGPGPAGPTYDAWPDERYAARPAGGAATSARDEDTLDFGRYAGWRIADVARVDPDHLRWLSRHASGIRYRAAISRCLPGETDLGRRASVLR